MTTSGSGTSEKPPLFLVKGEATAEEIAALTVVLQGLAAAAAPEGPRRARTQWSAPARLQRRTLRPGPGSWRASSLPQ